MHTHSALAVSLLLTTMLASPTLAGEPEVPDVAAAVERTLASETAGLDVFVSLDVPGQTTEPLVFVDVSGQIDFGAEVRGWFEGEMLGYGAMSVLMDGDDLYVSGDLMGDMLPAGSYLYVDAASAPPGFEELRGSFSLGNDASLALYWLLGADGPIEVVGQEAIGATDCTRIEVPIDLELVREHVPPEVLPIYEQNLADLREANADVDRAEAWIDSDGFVRRVAYDMPISLEGETGTMYLAYGFSGFGQPIELDLPDPALTVDAWDLLAGE